ncbi:MAG: hypothetical protein JWM95_4847 [Gemmatimonadetes bacterium]|nr:hypothetical protein [Gemmatimonadota bacterium]
MPAAGKGHVCKTMRSPVGTLTLVASDDGLSGILWEHERRNRVRLTIVGHDARHHMLCATERQLNEYFAGERTAFELPLDFAGTEFQQSVWRELLAIPFGETCTYTKLATLIGHPAAVRAVGAANGRNPISIVVPCHRVVGSTGKLTGFAGGLEAKALLLSLEQNHSGGVQNKTIRIDAI